MTPEYALFQAIRERIPPDTSFEQFLHGLVGWDVKPLHIDGELVGAAIVRGNELHVGLAKPCKASPRAMIRNVLAPIIKEHGFAVTAVMPDNRAGLAFCKRLGFVVSSFADGVYHLRCERANYV